VRYDGVGSPAQRVRNTWCEGWPRRDMCRSKASIARFLLQLCWRSLQSPKRQYLSAGRCSDHPHHLSCAADSAERANVGAVPLGRDLRALSVPAMARAVRNRWRHRIKLPWRQPTGKCCEVTIMSGFVFCSSRVKRCFRAKVGGTCKVPWLGNGLINACAAFYPYHTWSIWVSIHCNSALHRSGLLMYRYPRMASKAVESW
jgi:hypothetical protein